MEKAEQGEIIRSDDELNKIISDAIEQVIELFGNEMSERDKSLLLTVKNEETTQPYGRIMYLHRIPQSSGTSEELFEYVNNIKLTLSQKFTEAEKQPLRTWSGGNLLG